MGKYYLYGAGINCHGVIQFFGKDNIIAVIDGDETKWGRTIGGLTIVSLHEYLSRGHGEEIIITAFFERDSIAAFLEKQGIYHYYKCPYMQTGFYEDGSDMVRKLGLEQYPRIMFCTFNPISEQIAESIGEHIVVSYLDWDGQTEVESNIPVVLTNDDDYEVLQTLDNYKNIQKIFDINTIYREQFSFKNKNLLKFQNIHKGKRCFIIGNGPSLTYADLDCLHRHGEICFGVNRVYLAYEFTEWRPDYYVAVDYTIIQHDYEKILTLPGTKFIRHFYKTDGRWNDADTYEFGGVHYTGEPQLSHDIYKGVYIGNTVVYDAVQIALYMGFEEIYLLGVDMTAGIRYQDEGVHFYRSPDTKENLGTSNTPEARKCLGYAAAEMEYMGRVLRNATRGGELEEVVRVDFDSLF